jgi:hypothetical protein
MVRRPTTAKKEDRSNIIRDFKKFTSTQIIDIIGQKKVKKISKKYSAKKIEIHLNT